jgi:hypothetical protein
MDPPSQLLRNGGLESRPRRNGRNICSNGEQVTSIELTVRGNCIAIYTMTNMCIDCLEASRPGKNPSVSFGEQICC